MIIEPKILSDGYADMVSLFRDRQRVETNGVTSAGIRLMTVNQQQSDESLIRSVGNGTPYAFCPPGTYVVLDVDGKTMMGDTPLEKRTNQEIVMKAQGNVLVAGLGIGLIIHPIAQKSNVKSITILESNPMVIKLVAPTLDCYREKIAIHYVNARTYDPGAKYDTIYLDIWPSYGDHIIECPRLFDHYSRFLDHCGFMTAWMYKEQLLLTAQAYGVSVEAIQDAIQRMYEDGRDIEK
jgi:hypothetical protein